MVALKDILLQMLLAGSAVFLIPLFYIGLSRLLAKLDHTEKAHLSFAVSSVVSMLLCSLFAIYENSSMVPMSLGIIPVTLAILYCKTRVGVALSTLHILFYFLFAHSYDLYGFLLYTCILFYPIVWLSAGRFKHTTRARQMGILITLIFLELVVASLLWMFSIYHYSVYSIAYMIFTAFAYIAGGIIVGSLSLSWLERMKHYRGLEEHLSEVNFQYTKEMEQLNKILNEVPLSVATVDREGKVIFANDMLKQTVRERMPYNVLPNLIGQHASQFVEQSQMDKMNQSIQRAIVHGEVSALTVRYGSYVFQTRTVPIYDNAKELPKEVTGAILIIQDITELELLRRELDNVDRLSLVGQMAASITHEVRNPMAVVRGFLQLMQEKSPDSMDHYYRIVMEELDRANSIINDFLSLAQNPIAEKEESQLHDIIHELSPLLWADANLRGQSIELMLAHNLPKLQLNTKEIKQVVLNLARNAMEAMSEKGVLTLETRIVDNKVELCVRDTGHGIPLVRREKLFEPFYTTKTKGTGLGLPMCLSIVERHNGTITVESEEGRGTTFKVAFQR